MRTQRWPTRANRRFKKKSGDGPEPPDLRPFRQTSDASWAVRSRVWERTLEEHGYCRIAGVDEAGRGSLAGPVVAAAVILPRDFSACGVCDSKWLLPHQRETAFARIMTEAVAVGVGIVDHAEIDRTNILKATRLAMMQAVAALRCPPDFLLTDAVVLSTDLSCWALIKGDQRVLPIAAGSIVAKVTRDRLMVQYHGQFANYNFGDHKGYATADHLARLRRYGPCAIHRRTFRPVALSRRTSPHSVQRPVMPGVWGPSEDGSPSPHGAPTDDIARRSASGYD